MIHEKIFKGIKTEVAFRYYSKHYPDRNYSREQAQKQFIQDRNVDIKLISQGNITEGVLQAMKEYSNQQNRELLEALKEVDIDLNSSQIETAT